jgi:hypothetical protein
LTIRKVGIITTWNGIMSVTRMRMKTASRAKNLIRAKA